MTIPRILVSLVAAAAGAAFGGEPPSAVASAPASLRSPEAIKARQEADRQRLIAKLRADAPKTAEKAKPSVLDLPIFNRHNTP